MEGWLVSDQPSNSKGGDGDKRPAPLFAYTEKFKEVFPYYLSIGMTYDQFWNEDCELVKFYRKAAQIRQDLKNQDAWLQGAYFYEALVDAAPILRAFAKKGTKPRPYSTSPYALTVKEQKKEKEAKEKAVSSKGKRYMEALMASTNKKFGTTSTEA